MSVRLEIEDFLERTSGIPVIDVRSPGEYEHARIPGAVNIPLFKDVERAEVGTLYKQMGRAHAVKRGLHLVGPRLQSLIEASQEAAPKGVVGLHCWRGGMRSSSFAWLLETVEMDVCLLSGGYKSFRNWAIATLDRDLNILVVGGMTGSGKTEILGELKKRGEQILDLEGIARHKGSAFGWIGQGQQPSQAQFENELAMQIQNLDPARRVWVEDESRLVGRCVIPDKLWTQMRAAPVAVLNLPVGERSSRLLNEYGGAEKSELLACIQRIRKRFGGKRVSQAVKMIESGQIDEAVDLVLKYYDNGYNKGLKRRESANLHEICVESFNSEQIAVRLMNWASVL